MKSKLQIWLEFDHFSGPFGTGKHTKHTKQICNSYVAQIIDILRVSFAGATSAVIDTASASQNITEANSYISVGGGVNDNTRGIQVGTGTAATTITTRVMQTLIVGGNGASQLAYGVNSTTQAATSGTTRSVTMSRVFTNNSGASITIQEVGIYFQGGASGFVFLMERTLSVQAILNTASATATYTIGVTV